MVGHGERHLHLVARARALGFGRQSRDRRGRHVCSLLPELAERHQLSTVRHVECQGIPDVRRPVGRARHWPAPPSVGAAVRPHVIREHECAQRRSRIGRVLPGIDPRRAASIRRMDHLTLFDVRLEKSERLGTRSAAADVFNAFNSHAVRGLAFATSPSFLRPISIVAPRTLRIAARVRW